MFAVGLFIGALITAFVISRLILWLVKTWDGGIRKLIVVHVISLALCVLLKMEIDRDFTWAGTVALFGVAQLLCVALDLHRRRLQPSSRLS